MARITWQNVAAPDFSTALNARATAGDLFSRAASQFSGAMGDMATNKSNRQTAAAMDQALQINDIGAWDQMLAGQGVAGLGVAPDQATPELLSFIQGYREDLATDRQDDQNIQINTQNLETARYNQGRNQTMDGREDLAYSRSEEERTRGLDAQRIGEEILRGAHSETGVYSAAEAERIMLNMGLDPQTQAAVGSYLSGTGEGRFTGLSTTDLPAQSAEDITAMTRGINEDMQLRAVELAADETFNMWQTGMAMEGGAESPINQVIQNLRGSVDPGALEENGTTFDESVGEIQRYYNYLNDEFPQIPDGVIAHLLENNLEATSLLGIGALSWDDNRRFNREGIEDQLRSLSSEGRINSLIGQSQEWETQQLVYSTAQRKMELLSNNLRLAIDRGPEGEDEVTRLMGEISTLRQGLTETLGMDPEESQGNGSSIQGAMDQDPVAEPSFAAQEAAMQAAAQPTSIAQGLGFGRPAAGGPFESPPLNMGPATPRATPASPQNLDVGEALQDPRALASQEAVGNAVGGLANYFGPVVQAADAAATGAWNSTARIGNAWAYGAANAAAGLGATDVASRIFNYADRGWQNIQDSANGDGLIPDPERNSDNRRYPAPDSSGPAGSLPGPLGALPVEESTEVPAATQARDAAAEPSYMIEQAQQDPAGAIELMGSEANIPPSRVNVAKAAIAVLERGALTPAHRERAASALQEFMEEVRRSDQELSPEIEALLENAAQWIRI